MAESLADRFVLLTRTISRGIRTVTPNSVYLPGDVSPTNEGIVAAAHVLRIELGQPNGVSRIYPLQSVQHLS